MKLFPGEHLQDTLGLTLEQEGLVVRMMLAMWHAGGMVPQDEKELALLIRVSTKTIRKHRPIIARSFQFVFDSTTSPPTPMWSSKNVDKEIARYRKICDENAKNAKKGAEARWGSDAERHDEKMPNGIADGIANGNEKNAQSRSRNRRRSKELSPSPLTTEEVDQRAREARVCVSSPEPITINPEPSAGDLPLFVPPPPQEPRTDPAELRAKVIFDDARRSFPGMKRGLETEWSEFKKKTKDWRVAVFKLAPAIEKERIWRLDGNSRGAFIPAAWAHLSTWLNQRRWEQELPEHNPMQRPQPFNPKEAEDGARLAELAKQQR